MVATPGAAAGPSADVPGQVEMLWHEVLRLRLELTALQGDLHRQAGRIWGVDGWCSRLDDDLDQLRRRIFGP